MTRGPGVVDQSKGIGGSYTQLDTLDISEEPLELGRPIAGQAGASASISAVIGGTVTMTGLTGVSSDSLGNFITVSGATTPANNGTFQITAIFGATTVNYENALAVAPDANNGSISWAERQPYSLEDDINYARTNTKLIKGTLNWHDSIPTYTRPTDTLTEVDANLSNIAGKTLDAFAWLENRFVVNVPVSIAATEITINSAGNLKHATATDLTGVPVFDGYDVGNVRACFVAIIDSDSDGYGDGADLRVLDGANVGERIIGLTTAGSSTSPDSVEIAFYSVDVEDWGLLTLTPYSWEPDQPAEINVSYAYRQRLDLFDETSFRDPYILGAFSDIYGSGGIFGGGGGSGLSENEHKALRHLIHFIDSGPGDGFASGACRECLPVGSPFPTQIIWWESSSKNQKIVELIITRDAQQKPVTERWNMYDSGGIAIIAAVVDTITYQGPVEVSRKRDVLEDNGSGLTEVPVANNPDLESGSVLYYSGTEWIAIDAGISGQFLQSQGSGAPAWSDIVQGGGGAAVDGYVTIKNDGYEVSDEINCINFNSGLEVIDDGYNQVTIRAQNEFVAQDETGISRFALLSFGDYTSLTITERGIYDLTISFNWTASSTTVGQFEARLLRNGIPYNLTSLDGLNDDFPFLQSRPTTGVRHVQTCHATIRVYVGESDTEFKLQFRHSDSGEYADIWNGCLSAHYVGDIDLIDQIDDTTMFIRLRADRGTMVDGANETVWWTDAFTGRYFDDDGSSILGCDYDYNGWDTGIPTQVYTGSVPGFHADFDRYTSLSNDYTIFAVLDQANTSTTNQNIFEADNNFGAQARSGSGTDALGYVDGSGFNSFANGTAQTGKQALLFTFNSSNSTVSVYRDGVFVDSASYTSTTLGGEIGIGNYHNGSFQLSSGSGLAEVVLWEKVLSSSEQDMVWSYVTSRYGL